MHAHSAKANCQQLPRQPFPSLPLLIGQQQIKLQRSLPYLGKGGGEDVAVCGRAGKEVAKRSGCVAAAAAAVAAGGGGDVATPWSCGLGQEEGWVAPLPQGNWRS